MELWYIKKKKSGGGAIMAGEAKRLDENPISPNNHRPYSSPGLHELDVATKLEQLNVKQSVLLRCSTGNLRREGKGGWWRGGSWLEITAADIENSPSRRTQSLWHACFSKTLHGRHTTCGWVSLVHMDLMWHCLHIHPVINSFPECCRRRWCLCVCF